MEKDGVQAAYEKITYRKKGDRATNMPYSMDYNGGRITYRYDAMGNISEVHENGTMSARYAYDTLNRLVREDNRAFGKTETYTYDNNGNIFEKRTYAFTLLGDLEGQEYEGKKYTYDGDRLMKYGDEAFAYDGMGNPTTYRGKSVSWLKGRTMTAYDGISFTYDGRGRRTKKGNTEFTYSSGGKLLKQSDGLEFIYDASGVAGVIYNNATYLYRKDVQGNITALLDKDGKVVVEYKYDAWGNCKVLNANGNDLASGVGILNPFRYRGYYYDTETDLYYLQTRYYDPEVGRFISQDDVSYLAPDNTNGLNLYAYCGNNPVMATDPTGTDWSGFFTLLERIFTGISEFCRYIVKYPEKFKGSWKSARKINPKLSKRAFNRSWETALKETKALGKTLGKVATVLSFLSLAADIGNAWINNYKSGSSTWVSDSVVDTFYIGTRFAIGWGITALFTALIPIPILGTVIGVLVSLAADYLIQFVVSETGVLGSIKSWAADVGSGIAEGWNYFWSFAWI